MPDDSAVAPAAAEQQPAVEESEESSWQKSAPLVLWPHYTAEDALVEAVTNALGHLSGNEACVLADCHQEGVHQMRVALRRLRSRMALYRHILPPGQFNHAEGELKWLISSLGPARDWDVFLSETLPAATELLPDERDLAVLHKEAEKQREHAYARAAAAVRSRRYARLKSWLQRWIEQRRWRPTVLASSEAAVMMAPAGTLAETVLDKRHGKVHRRGARIREMDARERHKLRIQIKKLRYAVEFFDSLYSDNAVKVYVKALKDLQDGLGSMNDLSVGRELMAGLVKGWSGGSGGKRLRLARASGMVVAGATFRAEKAKPLPQTWESFAAVEPFW